MLLGISSVLVKTDYSLFCWASVVKYTDVTCYNCSIGDWQTNTMILATDRYCYTGLCIRACHSIIGHTICNWLLIQLTTINIAGQYWLLLYAKCSAIGQFLVMWYKITHIIFSWTLGCFYCLLKVSVATVSIYRNIIYHDIFSTRFTEGTKWLWPQNQGTKRWM